MGIPSPQLAQVETDLRQRFIHTSPEAIHATVEFVHDAARKVIERMQQGPLLPSQEQMAVNLVREGMADFEVSEFLRLHDDIGDLEMNPTEAIDFFASEWIDHIRSRCFALYQR